MALPTTVNKTITIDAPTAAVWKLLTTSDLVAEWLSETGTTVRSDWRVGSDILYSGTIHGIQFQDRGTILQVEAERLLQYSVWSKFSRLPDRPENRSVIEFRLSAQGDQTLLEVTHSNLVQVAGYQHSNFYWNGTLRKMKRLAETL